MSGPVDTALWLDSIHAHYCRQWVTPVAVAAEVLLGRYDAESVAASIARRGRRVGDEVMAATTPADVGGAMDELVALGFLESAIVMEHSPGHEEHVLALRIP